MCNKLVYLTIRALLYVLRFWFGLNTIFISTFAAFGERYSRFFIIVVALGLLLVALYHYPNLPWIFKLFIPQFAATILVLWIYWIWLGCSLTTRMFRITPSSLPAALLVSSILGSNIGTKLWDQLLNGTLNVKDLFAPVFEIHLKAGVTPESSDLEEASKKLMERYRGVLFYTYSPMAVFGLIRKSKVKLDINISSTTRINPRQARKYQERNKPFRFYLGKTPTN